jgi:hypothetical protein
MEYWQGQEDNIPHLFAFYTFNKKTKIDHKNDEPALEDVECQR